MDRDSEAQRGKLFVEKGSTDVTKKVDKLEVYHKIRYRDT